MPYAVIADFKGGLNQTRLPTTAPPGTLRELRNAHINRGGEIEKRKAFVAWRTLPSGTVGAAELNGVLHVFGTPPGLPVPAPIVYQRLVPSDGSNVTRILDVKAFSGALYVLALCSNGQVRHFYNGTQVTVFTGQTTAEIARILLPFNENVYAAQGAVLHRSGINAPTNWATSAVGAGFFVMNAQAQGAQAITGLSEYQSAVAVFSRRTTQIWVFAADPAQSAKQQTLRNVGCVSPLSVQSFAGTDVFFLSDSGVRSLRARDLTDSPAAADVGTAVDDLVGTWLASATADDLEKAHAVIEPTDGRYWLALGSTVYVFSFFPAAKISAWSRYDLPGVPDTMVAADRRLYVRVADTIYLYGGENGATYDSTEAEAELQFLDGRQIATWKRWTGLDIAAEGQWAAFAALQPSTPDTEDLIATLDGNSMHQLDIPMAGQSPMVKLRFATTGSTAARLGAVAAHYEREGAA